MKGFIHNCNDRDLTEGQGTLQLKKKKQQTFIYPIATTQRNVTINYTAH